MCAMVFDRKEERKKRDEEIRKEKSEETYLVDLLNARVAVPRRRM